MRIDIHEAFKAPGQVFDFESREHLPDMAFGDAYLERGQAVHVEGHYCLTKPGRVMVRARIKACMAAVCARCANTASFEVCEETEQLFSEVHGGTEAEKEEYTYTGRQLDLSVWVRDIVLSALPLRIYCNEQCKGLCPICGADLNQGACAHVKV